MRKEEIVRSGRFAFDYFRCLRSEFAKNECRLCIDVCPEEAMVFDRKRLTLDPLRCTECAACMGSCPTQAFSHEEFDADRFVLEFSQSDAPNLSCKENLPCLAALSPEHYAAIALRKEGPVACDLAHCAECEVNKEGRVYDAVVATLDEADRFLATMGSEARIGREPLAAEESETESAGEPDPARRALLTKFAAVTAPAEVEEEEVQEADLSELAVGEEGGEPVKRRLLKNAMKKRAELFPEQTAVPTRFSFVVGKRIDATACNNCQECAMFCPTGALSILQDNTGIIFQLGKCVACGICNDVCQPRAIADEETFDLVNFAFDRMDLLVRHRLEICEECKIAFPYRGGEKVCDRCRDFKDRFLDLFTLAKDLP